MSTPNPFFDDLTRVANGALGALSGLRAEVEQMIRQQMDRLMATMDLVHREDFEAVRAMAAKARDEQEALTARVAALEARLAGASPPPVKAPVKRAAAKPKAAAAKS